MTIIFLNEAGREGGVPAEEVGAKAAILAKVAAAGVPVPPAFVLPIRLGAVLIAGHAEAEKEFAEGLREGIEYLENATGRRFGDRREPLLVSVRSGAARSMPGMLDTVLDVGCTKAATRGLIRLTGNPRFAWDCRRRFLEAYAETVLGLDPAKLFSKRDALIALESAETDRDLDSEALERLVSTYESEIAEVDLEIPDDPMQQLSAAARAVYQSWMSDRACTYRRLQGLDYLEGSAVTVQAMVFGNKGSSSGAGVAFSRDPSTGVAVPQIDVLFEAQGEDVVSGRRTPMTEKELAVIAPAAAEELRRCLVRLERQFKDVQDVEFTIEDGKLWILQSRAAKRTPRAALKIAVDLVREGMLTPAQGLRQIEDLDLGSVAMTKFTGEASPLARGVGAAAGVAVGIAAFDSPRAEQLASAGDPVILIRPDIDTSDVQGMVAALGVLTASGGRTAHAALIARQLGRACVVGCNELEVKPDMRLARIGSLTIKEGDWVSIDGGSGEVFLGQREILTDRPEADLKEIARWRPEMRSPAEQGDLACVD
jgi:pyruvate, orthophosphate dikinase